jgi:hypothetical protein
LIADRIGKDLGVPGQLECAAVDFEEERLEAVVLLCGNGVEARAFVKCRAGRVDVDSKRL